MRDLTWFCRAILRQWWRERHERRTLSGLTSVAAVGMTRREEYGWLMGLTGEALTRLVGRGAALTPAGKARLERLIALRGRVDQERARCDDQRDEGVAP